LAKEQAEPVTADEDVLRRVLREHYRSDLAVGVLYAAFRPTDSDTDGISVYRVACGATNAEVIRGPSSKGYVVATLRVSEILALDIDGLQPTVVATPQTTGTLGHASIPELNVVLRDGDRRRYRLLAQRLAELGSRQIFAPPL